MPVDRGSLETKRAMFWAQLAAQCAGETCVTEHRIAAALLRTASVREFCSRAQIDAVRVLDAVENSQTMSFEECEREVERQLAQDGVAFGSKEHQARIQFRPVGPAARIVINAIIQRHGHMGATPLELLLDLISVDRALAECLAPHGLHAEAISAALE